MASGMIFNIMRYSISDGPGIRTTVFFKGCPLHCWWCHNPESQAYDFEEMFRKERCLGCGACRAACPRGALSAGGRDWSLCRACGLCIEACPSGAREGTGRKMSMEEVMAEIEKDVLFYDQSGGGVTFSGGEPLAQPVFLRSLLAACRKKEISTAVDTSGFGSWELLRDLASYTDMFLYDLKIMDDEKHRECTGVSNREILRNLQRLSKIHARIILRFPIIPGYTDSPGNVRALGAFLQGLNAEGIELLPYHTIGTGKYAGLGKLFPLRDTRPPSQEGVEAVKSILEEFELKNIKGGISHEG